MARHGDYLLTRDKSGWVVRNLKGQYVKKDVKKRVLKEVFTPKKYREKRVEFTRSYLGRDKKDYVVTDAVVYEDFPYDVSDKEIQRRLESRELLDKMDAMFDKPDLDDAAFSGWLGVGERGGWRFVDVGFGEDFVDEKSGRQR